MAFIMPRVSTVSEISRPSPIPKGRNTRKGCWTCTDRKIQCDGGLPGCQKCARARRECQGYEKRLSWPKNGDKKRAMTRDTPSKALSPSRGVDFFINTSWRDVELHHNVLLGDQSCPPFEVAARLQILSQPYTLHTELIHHFQTKAYLTLVTYAATNAQLRDTLLRMVINCNTSSSLAAFYALLAFSSAHRGGLHTQAVKLKILALQHLSASTKQGSFDLANTAQQVAASMLLSAFEIQAPSESSKDWLRYIRGALDITQATALIDQSHDEDVANLLDWVYYHNTLSRFPAPHGRKKQLTAKPAARACTDSDDEFHYPPLMTYRITLPSPSPTHAILNLLSDAGDVLLAPPVLNTDDDSSLKALTKRADDLYIPDFTEPDVEGILGARIWRMATRVFIARATQIPQQVSPELESEIEEGFLKITTFYSCRHFFPLFILACEANTEERRAAIIGLVARTEKSGRVRSLKKLMGLIMSIWVQQDLHMDGELLVDYLGIIDTVFGSRTTSIPFV